MGKTRFLSEVGGPWKGQCQFLRCHLSWCGSWGHERLDRLDQSDAGVGNPCQGVGGRLDEIVLEQSGALSNSPVRQSRCPDLVLTLE
jgi:hypothetical protein